MKKAKADSFGYSDTRLWYGLCVFTGTALLLMPLVGSFWALALPMVPALYISTNAIKRYTKTYADISWEVHEYVALAERAYNFDVFTLIPNNPLSKTPIIHTRIYKDLFMKPGFEKRMESQTNKVTI